MFQVMDITGQRFGRLTAIERVPAKGQAQWLTACDCGNKTVVRSYPLRMGLIKSCGCWLADRITRLNTKHGQARRGAVSPAYGSWVSLKRRCLDPTDLHWPNYGGRGIQVCERWLDFVAFYEDMGDRPEGMTIDRIDNDGDYEPGNCRWATMTTQGQNTRLAHLMTKDGITQSLSAWARQLGVPRRHIQDRLKGGMSDEEALATR